MRMLWTPIALLAGGLAWAQPSPPAGVILLRDVVYARVGDRELHMDIARPTVLPRDPMPVLVHIHGGGWVGGDYHTDAIYGFAQSGYFTVSIEYRLSPEANFPAQIHDCKAAIRYLRANAQRYHLNPARIGVLGASAGGHLAALLGTSGGVKALEGDLDNLEQSSRVQAVVDLFGPSDLPTMISDRGERLAPVSPEDALLGGLVEERLELARQASPLTYVTRTDPPFLIFHGEKDKIVAIAQSERLHGALRAAGVESTFIRDPECGHELPAASGPGLTQLLQAIGAFLDKHLRPAPGP